jgi:cell division protease FtsH
MAAPGQRGRAGGRKARAAAGLPAAAIVLAALAPLWWASAAVAGAAPLANARDHPAAPVASSGPETLSLSSLFSLGRDGSLRTAVVNTDTDTVQGTVMRSGHRRTYQANFPAGYGPRLTDQLLADRVSVTAAAAGTASAASGASGASGSGAGWLFAMLVIVVIAMVAVGAVRRRLGGRGASSASRGLRPQSPTNPAGFTKGRGEQVQVPSTRFSDVAGVDEAVDVFRELVSYLRDPEPFRAAGADLPHGYLLVGPPGTGKTLLARAVAGEAGVPYFAIGASEFVESYVGVGAARVRALFDRARAVPSAIVFVDELDAIGRARSAHAAPGNEERESTLNQLLVEMDGFSDAGSVVVLAATNRPDILDAALLRPGRFDRQIDVPVPDRLGRARILGLYLQRRKVADEVDVTSLSRRTGGFTGADLANLVNTAALAAVRAGNGVITTAHIDEALATVALGPARTSAVVAQEDRRITAWHETGHALVGLWLEEAEDPISVSIVPRGPAGGVTWFPGHDAPFMTRRQAKAQLAVSMAGRAAEELLLGDDFTQGGAQDFRVATDLARRMVTEFGMGSIGPGYVPPEETHIGVLAERVHDATEELLDEALSTARSLLGPARATIEGVVERLLEEETLDTAALVSLAGPRRNLPAVRSLPLPHQGAA